MPSHLIFTVESAHDPAGLPCPPRTVLGRDHLLCLQHHGQLVAAATAGAQAQIQQAPEGGPGLEVPVQWRLHSEEAEVCE